MNFKIRFELQETYVWANDLNIQTYEILLDHLDQLRMQLVHVALTLHSASMLYLPSLLGSSYHECAIRNERKTENTENGNVCSKLLARIIRTSTFNLVNIAQAIND